MAPSPANLGAKCKPSRSRAGVSVSTPDLSRTEPRKSTAVRASRRSARRKSTAVRASRLEPRINRGASLARCEPRASQWLGLPPGWLGSGGRAVGLGGLRCRWRGLWRFIFWVLAFVSPLPPGAVGLEHCDAGGEVLALGFGRYGGWFGPLGRSVCCPLAVSTGPFALSLSVIWAAATMRAVARGGCRRSLRGMQALG